MRLRQLLHGVAAQEARDGPIDILTFTGGAFAQNTILGICDDRRTALLIDPGAATAEALAEATRRKLDIAAILLTHAHLDHIEGAALAKETTGAPIHLHPADRNLYENVHSQALAFGVPFTPPPPLDRDLVPGGVLEFGGSALSVVHAPGHAPGHVIFVSASHPFAIVGDVVFLGSIGRTDLPGGDYRTLIDSIERTILPLPPDTRLHPGHGPETTAGHERRTNPFLSPVFSGVRV